MAAIGEHGLGNTSYNPKRRSCVDLSETEEQDAFFDEFSKGGMSVYIVGIVSNRGGFCDETRDAYVRLCVAGNAVMLGQWTAPDGAIYRDVVLVVSGIDENEALRYKRRYGQLSIMEVKHGSSRYI